jgi:hypothetical protein
MELGVGYIDVMVDGKVSQTPEMSMPCQIFSFPGTKRKAWFEDIYPIAPRMPMSGSIQILKLKPKDFFAIYNFDDPMFYTPERIKQLRRGFLARKEAEKIFFKNFHSYSFKTMMYHEMQLEMANLYLLDRPFLSRKIVMNARTKLSQEGTYSYKSQVNDLFKYNVDPQKQVLLGFIWFMQELGVGHVLDCDTLFDIYEMSLYHPNALVCHGCNKIELYFEPAGVHCTEFVMCTNNNCVYSLQRRDVPSWVSLSLPFEGFNLKTYYKHII